MARMTALLAALLLAASSLPAKDFGGVGQLYPIAEPDILETIRTGFIAMERDGRMERLRRLSVAQVKRTIERPRGASLPRATAARSFAVDLSITLERDLEDHQGRVFARAGTVINPLYYSKFDKRIVMIDGDDPAQVAFALEAGDEQDTLIVLARGAPLELMRAHGRRFWFDSDQQMLTKFNITALPSVVTRGAHSMRVSEVPVGLQMEFPLK